MTRFALRTALASLAGALALAAPGVAAAVPVVSGDDAADAPSTVDPVVTQTFVEVEVAPTGDGPATEEDCQKWETRINTAIANLTRALVAGDGGAADLQASLLESDEDSAMDAGCFIIY